MSSEIESKNRMNTHNKFKLHALSLQQRSAHTLHWMKFITAAIKLNRFRIIAANYSARLTDMLVIVAVVLFFQLKFPLPS